MLELLDLQLVHQQLLRKGSPTASLEMNRRASTFSCWRPAPANYLSHEIEAGRALRLLVEEIMDNRTSLSAPVAPRRSYSYHRHGVEIEDPWHWLRDPSYPDVDKPEILDYLNAENAYFDSWRAQHEQLIDQLFGEMKGRIQEDESSVPIR